MCTPRKSISGIVLNKLEIKIYFEDSLDFLIANNEENIRSTFSASERQAIQPMQPNNQFEEKGPLSCEHQ